MGRAGKKNSLEISKILNRSETVRRTVIHSMKNLGTIEDKASQEDEKTPIIEKEKSEDTSDFSLDKFTRMTSLNVRMKPRGKDDEELPYSVCIKFFNSI